MNAKVAVVACAAGLGLFFTGCPPQGVVCKPGTNACGDGCADFTRDRRNCGGCGLACQTAEDCQNSQCVCAEGATQCNGRCVVLATDSQNCGACGAACAPGDVCAPGSNGVGTCQAVPAGDAGVFDGGVADAGAFDGGEADAGELDAGEIDAGTDGGDGGP